MAPSERARVVLVVDDETDVREMLREILRRAGFSPLTAHNGEDALAVIRHFGGRIDLVLTDVMMPALDGPTLSRRLARDWPSLPVLFMTGYPAGTLAALGYLPESAPRVEKPFEIGDLVGKVRAAMGLPPQNPRP